MFLVCAELSRRNLIALPTSRNTKGYDIVVMDPKNGEAMGIQVKCTDRKDFPVFTSHFRDFEQKIGDKIVAPFVFVDISDLATPRYFILSKEEMQRLLKHGVNSYMGVYSRKHGQSREETLQREKKANLWAVKLRHIESFENHWEVVMPRATEADKTEVSG